MRDSGCRGTTAVSGAAPSSATATTTNGSFITNILQQLTCSMAARQAIIAARGEAAVAVSVIADLERASGDLRRDSTVGLRSTDMADWDASGFDSGNTVSTPNKPDRTSRRPLDPLLLLCCEPVECECVSVSR
jgi:hypothetical protein